MAENKAITGEQTTLSRPMTTRRLLSEHLLALEGGPWAVWRCIGLRGAGFPIASLVKLSTPECALAADQLLQAEVQANQVRATALEAMTLTKEQTGANKQLLLKLIQGQITGDSFPELSDTYPLQPPLKEIQATNLQIATSRKRFKSAYEIGIKELSHSLYEMATSRQFREAVIWQNRRAFHTGIKPLLRNPIGRSNAKHREHEMMVASYVQRYCAKNDTIGFFGPVGWARFVRQGSPLEIHPGPQLLAIRNVYFESWGIQALADLLTKDKRLRPWCIPRRSPFMYRDNTACFLPQKGAVPLSIDHLKVLDACDGERTAQEVAQVLVENPARGLKQAEDVFSILEGLCLKGLIYWAFEVPVELHSEKSLRRQLDRITDESLRQSALSVLDMFEVARERISNANNDPDEIDQAIEELESSFTHLTGRESTHSAGKTYAARTLIFEDCCRDITVNIGPAVLEALGPPLSLLLASARWFTFQFAAIYRQAFTLLYEEIMRKSGSPTVDATLFWQLAQPLLFQKQNRLVQILQANLHKRWASLLTIPQGVRLVEFSSKALRPQVEAAFAVPHAGWSSARCHSPDVLIAATAPDAICQGNFRLVMGELHVGGNTLGMPLFRAQHPNPEELLQAYTSDQTEPRVALIPPRNWPRQTARTMGSFISPKDWLLISSPDTCGIPQSQALSIGNLIIEQTNGDLRICTRDRRLSFDIIEVFADLLAPLAADAYSVYFLAEGSHTPRVLFDQLVVCRERWTFKPKDMLFAYEKEPGQRFLGARRWAQEHGMPRFVFVKSPGEVKPYYVDFESPIYIDIMAKTVRLATKLGQPDLKITLTEMLPTPDQTWLEDGQGHQYSSELRIIAVDLAEVFPK